MSETLVNKNQFFSTLKTTGRFSDSDLHQIKVATKFCQSIYKGRRRIDDSSVFSHCLSVSNKLGSIGAGRNLVIASLLHNGLEVDSISPKTLIDKFGEEVAFLVYRQDLVEQYRYRRTNHQHLGSYKRFLVATAQDVRVLVLKLIDRWHNVQTIIKHFPKDKQKQVAEENLLIYGRLANYFNLYQIQYSINDKSFLIAEPELYNQVQEIRRLKIKKSAKIMKTVKRQLLLNLTKEMGYQPIVKHRVKSIYSLYQKLANKGWNIDKIGDLIAFRIIVDNKKHCYQSLSFVHNQYQPVKNRFKDYIVRPKANGYQSLHTTIQIDKTLVEFQIRTNKMDENAENGLAAHHIYKQSKSNKKSTSNNWLFRIKDLPTKTENYSSNFELFDDRIFVFTPKRDIIDLPKSATVLDFAYAVHEQVGKHAKGGIIGGLFKPLKTQLSSNDVIEIIVNKRHSPTRQWLNWSITKKAQSSIKRGLRLKKTS